MKAEMNSFTVWDYLVFFATLVTSMGIGVYFAVQGRKKKTEGEFLMASRSMSVIPVSISIAVSFLSAISILGSPAEMYTQGGAFILYSLSGAGGSLLNALLFVPLLYPLNLTSSFEYLEKRFNSKAVRRVGSLMNILTQIIYMGTASFAPATAFEIVTGFPVWGTLLISAVVCTFYTSVGGMKAVIWTDVFQCLVMVAGVMAVIIQGSIKVGSFWKTWDINKEWGRLDIFNFDPDPTIRHTLWGFTIGATLNSISVFGLSQAAVQRYSSLPTLKKAQMATILIVVGFGFISLSCCICGIVIFAYYVTKNCDPLGKHLVENSNQIVPFFVMETLAYPCVPGIFMSALFSGSLSSISSSLNAMTAITWEDFLKPLFHKHMTESKRVYVLQALVVAYGCIALGVSLIVQSLEGTVLQISISLTGAVMGPMAGMFLLGAFFPWANAKGAIWGSVLSLAFILWIAVGAFVTGLPKDKFTYPNGTCSEYFVNDSDIVMTTTEFPTTVSSILTGVSSSNDKKDGLEQMYALSYLWYTGVGILATVVLGLIISFLTGASKISEIPTKYQIPVASKLLCCLPKSWQWKLDCHRDFETYQYKFDKMATTEPAKTYSSMSSKSSCKVEFDNEVFTSEDNPSLATGTTKED